MGDQHDDIPVGPNADRAYRALSLATAELAATCAMALAEKGLFTDARSREAEQGLRAVGGAARIGAGQIAETVFDRLADSVARLRSRQG